MNRFRRLTSALLALAMILSLLGGMGPMTAEAKGNDSFNFTAVVVNPLYQDIISEEDIPLPQKAGSWGGVAAIAEPDYLDGEEEAALAIREAMVNRETEPVIYFSSTFAVNSQEDFQVLLEDLFSSAYAHTGVPNEGDYLRWHYGGYGASISGGYGEDNTTIYYELSLELIYYTTAAQEAEVDSKIDQLMDSWNVDSENDYIILKTIYDYICANIVYDYEHVNDENYKMQYTAYAALIDDVAVCQGYANLFYRLALEYGIDARLIAGDGGGPHGWNIAQLNGLYYNLDSTWDAGYTDYDYFLVCPDNFTDHIRYEEYDTAAFHAAYPMDDEDFDPNSMGCSHAYGEPVDTATCTEAGTKTYICSKCGETKTEASPALGHSGGTASCTQQAVCTVCGEAYGELADHDYADEWASDADNHWLPCQDCGTKSNMNAHTPNVEAATEETEKYCTICGYVMEEALSHSHSTTQVAAVAATCTEAGSRAYYTCDCGKWFEDAEATKEITDKTSIVIDALGHDTELQNQKDATEAEPGYTGDLVCKRCEEVIEEGEEIPVLPSTQVAEIKRVAGSIRYETAIQAANALKEALGVEKFENIVLACGGFGGANDNGFADALSGSYLAAVKKAPILLHYGNKSVDVNVDYIQSNLASGGTVYILGGNVSVPETVETALEDAGITVRRLAGDNRFLTNLEILSEAEIGNKEILISSGWGFADSLSLSATGLPVLLLNSTTGKLTQEQTDFLKVYKGNTITVIGGTAAISEDLQSAVEEVVGKDVERIYGATREETSVAIAKAYFDAPEFAVIAYSRAFPDGLCGGPLAYAMGAPMLLTNVNQTQINITRGYLEEMEITSGYIMGGESILNDQAAKAIFGISTDAVIPSV